MIRDEFRAALSTAGPAVLPVIHALGADQVRANLRLVVEAGAPGAFLINHDYDVATFLPVIRAARVAFPGVWMGVNFLAVTLGEAASILGRLADDGVRIDAYWADDARIDERADTQAQAEEIAAAHAASGWQGLYFGGTAFKKQRPVDPRDHERAARIAAGWMDVVTTSGTATGQAADTAKIAAFRRGVGDAPLAIASGLTPENAADYRAADAFLVATGINRPGDFYTIDPTHLAAMLEAAAALGEPA